MPVTVLQSAGLPLTGVQGLPPFGPDHSCALLAGGEARCWGNNGSGQLGDGTSNEGTALPTVYPVTVLLPGVRALALGGYHTCGLPSDSRLRCWGFNDYGQLGDITTELRPSPVSVQFPPGLNAR